MAWYNPVRRIIQPWIQFIRNIPPLAYVPLIVIAAGVGRKPQIIVITIATCLIMCITMYQGIVNIDETLIKQISVAAEHKNKGARGLNDYLTHLRGKLISYRDINEKSLKNEIHKLHVDYNENTDNFEVRRVEQ